eukprot:4950866-Lingulodinium_polyedra.AAC.1
MASGEMTITTPCLSTPALICSLLRLFLLSVLMFALLDNFIPVLPVLVRDVRVEEERVTRVD